MPIDPENSPRLIPQVMSALFDACANGVTLVDALKEDLPLIYANAPFEAMTGYGQAELIGRNCRFLQGDDRDQAELGPLRQALRLNQTVTVTLRNYRKTGELFYSRLAIKPLFDAAGQLRYFLGDHYDVTELIEGDGGMQLFPESQYWLSLSAGQVLFREGEPGEVMYVVIDGEIDIIAHHEWIATVSGPAGIVGEMALIDTAPRSAKAVAKTHCTLVSLTKARFLSLIRHNPHFALEVMQVLGERIRRLLSAHQQHSA